MPNENATNLNRYKDGFSTALILTQGPGSLVSEALLGTRSANGDAFGINIQPGYFLTEKLQLATRCHHGTGGSLPELRDIVKFAGVAGKHGFLKVADKMRKRQ